jgi:DNA polymerase III epsilon subunit family exonuclease
MASGQTKFTNVEGLDFPQEQRDALLHFFPNGVIAFDVETTGLSPLMDKIIELSAFKLTREGLSSFDTLINPQIKIPEETIAIHGINDSMVQDAPDITEVLPEFFKFTEGLPLVAHNAKFDCGFVVFQSHFHDQEMVPSKIYCSCQFSRSVFKDSENHKLATLVKHLDIPLENHHRALDDAKASLQIVAIGCDSDDPMETARALELCYYGDLSDYDKNVELEIPAHLELLKRKIRQRHVIELRYSGGSMKNKLRPIKPLSLLPQPEGNILYAHCLVSDLHKSFLLSKIKEVKEPSSEMLQKYLKDWQDLKKANSYGKVDFEFQ